MYIEQDVSDMPRVYGKTLATSNGKELMLDPFNRPYFFFQVDESDFQSLWICKVKDTESKGQVFMSI